MGGIPENGSFSDLHLGLRAETTAAQPFSGRWTYTQSRDRRGPDTDVAQPQRERAFAGARARMEAPRPGRHRRGGADQPDPLHHAPQRVRLGLVLGRAGRLRDDRDLPRGGRRARPQADPVADDLRRRERAQARRHHLPAAPLVLAQEVPPHVHLRLAVPDRRADRRDLPGHELDHRDGRRAQGHPRRPRRGAPARPDARDPLPDQLPDPVRAAGVPRNPADQGLRARRRGLGREARGRSRPGRGQGGDHPRRLALAVGGGVREGRRQARARRAVPRPARHRQDDALQGHRHLVQLPVRDDPGLGLRPDLHRHGRGDRALPRPQGEEARGEVGRPVHRLHRRDRRRGHAPPVARQRVPALQRRLDPRPSLLRPRRGADARRRPADRVTRVARPAVHDARRAARRRLPAVHRPDEGRDRPVHDPRHGRRRLAGAQPAAGRDGRHRRPAADQARLHEPAQHLPRRALRRPPEGRPGEAAQEAAAAAQGGDLLRRRLQRADRVARPRAHAPRPDGPPHLLPHADVGGPARHLRPLHQEGRPRPGARHAEEARRARARHLRLFAGHDRPGVLDGADLRALGRPPPFHLGGHRRGDDDGGGRRRDRAELPAARGARHRDPRGGPRGLLAPLQREPDVDPTVDPQARLLRRPPPGDGDRGALRRLALGDVRPPHPRARRDGRRGRLLRPEHDRRRRRRPLGHLAGRPHGRLRGDGPAHASTCPTGSTTRHGARRRRTAR